MVVILDLMPLFGVGLCDIIYSNEGPRLRCSTICRLQFSMYSKQTFAYKYFIGSTWKNTHLILLFHPNQDFKTTLTLFLACGGFCHLLIQFLNRINLDQDRQNVDTDLVPDCLTP